MFKLDLRIGDKLGLEFELSLYLGLGFGFRLSF